MTSRVRAVEFLQKVVSRLGLPREGRYVLNIVWDHPLGDNNISSRPLHRISTQGRIVTLRENGTEFLWSDRSDMANSHVIKVIRQRSDQIPTMQVTLRDDARAVD